MTQALDIDNVSVHYGDTVAVRHASVTLASGEIGCLLGPSGCGKTSLLRAIGGFEAIRTGSISLNGTPLSRPGFTLAPEYRRVGMVFQDYALFPHLTVGGNVRFGLGSLSRDEATQRVDDMLRLVELPGYSRSYPHELSGGQQQRVALARALAARPEILLLDEPFSNLDATLREDLALQVRQLLKRLGVTAVLVTHDQQEAFAMADRIALLQAGAIVQSDTPQKIYEEPKTEFSARFVGRGDVIELPPSSPLLQSWQVHIRPSDDKNTAPLRLLLRAHCVIHDPDSEVRLDVLDRIYRGSHYAFVLALPDGQRIHSLVPTHQAPTAEERLPVRLDLSQLVVLAD